MSVKVKWQMMTRWIPYARKVRVCFNPFLYNFCSHIELFKRMSQNRHFKALHPELDIQLSLFDHTDKPHIAVEYNDGSKQRTDTFKYWPYDDTNVPPLRRMNWEEIMMAIQEPLFIRLRLEKDTKLKPIVVEETDVDWEDEKDLQMTDHVVQTGAEEAPSDATFDEYDELTIEEIKRIEEGEMQTKPGGDVS